MAEAGSNGATPVAAVDLGSNSFHLLIGRVMGGQLSVLDRLRDPVRLAAGLDEEERLSAETLERMLESLGRFRERLQDLAPQRVRAIGTNTFRKAREPVDLLRRASEALGCPIEVLSGHEEARLIYLGVAHDRPGSLRRRLVVDIGGGSTECILGEGFRPLFLDSLYIGCVSFSKRFFPGGKLTRKGFRRAEVAAKLELETIQRRYCDEGWSSCVGSSGTINAVSQILQTQGWTDGAITLPEIKKLRKELIAAEEAERLDLGGLQADRRPVLAGGLAILKAVFETLDIESMHPSKAALREGLLYDLLGRIRHEDVRDRTIRSLSERFHVDQEHALKVEQAALACLDQVAETWELEDPECAMLLSWAARTHELGLALAYNGHHKHGAYLLENSTMPGFSRQEQQRLGALVRGHRRKFSRAILAELAPEWTERIQRLCVLLRLAVRLNRTRSAAPLPAFELAVVSKGLELRFPEAWLSEHPLLKADLEQEDAALTASGLRLLAT